jgi:hypothetical protein
VAQIARCLRSSEPIFFSSNNLVSVASCLFRLLLSYSVSQVVQLLSSSSKLPILLSRQTTSRCLINLKDCLLRATIPNITRQPLQANSSAQDKAPGKHEANALLQLFAQDNKIAHECVNQCLVKFKEDTLDQVLCCLWNLPIYRSERIKLAEWLLREGKMLFRCSLAECMCLNPLKRSFSSFSLSTCCTDDRPVNEREIMSDIPKLWVDELNKTKLDTTQKRKIKEQFAIKIMSNRNAQQSATNGYKRPGDPKPPASERPGLFRPTEAELKKGHAGSFVLEIKWYCWLFNVNNLLQMSMHAVWMCLKGNLRRMPSPVFRRFLMNSSLLPSRRGVCIILHDDLINGMGH